MVAADWSGAGPHGFVVVEPLTVNPVTLTVKVEGFVPGPAFMRTQKGVATLPGAGDSTTGVVNAWTTVSEAGTAMASRRRDISKPSSWHGRGATGDGRDDDCQPRPGPRSCPFLVPPLTQGRLRGWTRGPLA